MKKLECPKNLEISLGLSQRRWWETIKRREEWEDYWHFFKKLRN